MMSILTDEEKDRARARLKHSDRTKSVRLNKVTYDRLKRLSMRSREPRMTMKDIVAYLVDICPRYELLDPPTYEEKDRAVVFVRHIEKHLEKWAHVNQVVCKICGKTLDEIYEEDRA